MELWNCRIPLAALVKALGLWIGTYLESNSTTFLGWRDDKSAEEVVIEHSPLS
jgi:hypothetical protein